MNKKFRLRLLLFFVALALLLKVVSSFIIEPWLARKIENLTSQPGSHYSIKVQDVDISLLTFGVRFSNLKIYKNESDHQASEPNGEISFISLSGIHVFKFLFSHKLVFRELVLSQGNFSDKVSLSKRSPHPFTPPYNIYIETISMDHMYLNLQDSSSSRTYHFSDSHFGISDFVLLKGEKLFQFASAAFEFQSPQLVVTSPDSMYTFIADSIVYSTVSEMLTIDSFLMHPNYKDYDFTSRERYQIDRIEGSFIHNYVYGFCLDDFLKHGDIIFREAIVEDLEMDVFRDRRKPFEHKQKPVFQDILEEYAHTIDVDSIHLLNGDIQYTEHAEDANHPGSVRFKDARASFYTLSNDTLRRELNDTLIVKAEAMLYGKSKLRLRVNAKLFDPHHTFALTGRLAPMLAKDLNPILERNAFLYAHGKINSIDFDFVANQNRSSGRMLFLYNDLSITLKNKTSDDTTGIKEKVLSKLANKIMIDDNPKSGESPRTAEISYQRDPEKMFFNYILKSILSGIKPSVNKAAKKKKG